ncbi:hypothetical protein [Thiomicrorhabdus sp.]|uniref:hypothetical protein n=1 Tax=Thiomicrorhabdus sp. TaxID=2039724 RepID=UPI002AA60C82|nr:hypothetical protein [Thiomicrorhabdus sp.]
MKLKRRGFLGLATKLVVTTSIPSVLVACGGGGGTDSAASVSSVSSVSTQIAAVNTQQNSLDSTNSQLSSELGQVTTASSTPASVKSTAISVEPTPTTIQEFFSTRLPDYSVSPDATNPAFSSVTAHYLIDGSSTGTEFWKAQVAAHQNAYSLCVNQLTKLKATLRLFDHKNSSALEATEQSSAQIKATAIAVKTLEPEALSLVDILTVAINVVLNNGLTSSLLDAVATAIKSIADYLVSSSLNVLTKYSMALLANLAIDDLLQGVAQKSITNLDYSSKQAIMLSLGKISVASAAIIGASKIQEVESATTEQEDDLIKALLSSGDLASKMSMVWLSLIDGIMGETFSAMQTGLTQSKTAFISEADGTNIQDDIDKAALATTLQEKASLLAITALSVKTLLSLYVTQATQDYVDTNPDGESNIGLVENMGFDSQSTAKFFSFLFGSVQNADDQTLVNALDLTSIIDAFKTFFANDATTDGSAKFDALSVVSATTLKTSSKSEAVTETNTVDAAAMDFATQLASFAYQFTSETESDAFDFATHMADLAYQFTMDIEEDAYQFAMQGMEYGYLFASRGEEVGVMADRILWMAVQIGVMADRIGEMADRIVYTEQLIVYTEILILDFGMLIYGTIKQITNLILTGMALILDREWYQPQTQDIVVDMVKANVATMLENMNEYAQHVLDNQVILRTSTQDAIDTIDFANRTAT